MKYNRAAHIGRGLHVDALAARDGERLGAEKLRAEARRVRIPLFLQKRGRQFAALEDLGEFLARTMPLISMPGRRRAVCLS